MPAQSRRMHFNPSSSARNLEGQSRPTPESQPDGCSVTDPDPRVGLLQAQSCNMRSKCRCSCVLQFTLCHAFSCVLHRPPSQLIHCIALYFGYQTARLLIVKKKKNHLFTQATTRGGRRTQNPWAGKLSLNRLRHQPQGQPEHTQPAPRGAGQGSGLDNPGQTSLGS